MKTKIILIGIGTGFWLNAFTGALAQAPDPAAPRPPQTPGPALSPVPPPPAGVRLQQIVPRAIPGAQFIPNRGLQAAIIEEERNLDLESARNAYQQIIRQFDQQREEAAQAIFRLGEVYRKLGSLEEAKVQYGRILREFPDQRELAQLSLQHLFQAPAAERFAVDRRPAPTTIRRPQTTNPGMEPPMAAVPLPPGAMQRQMELIDEEIALLERQLDNFRRRMEAGHDVTGADIQVQREILGLKREKAELEQRGQIFTMPAPRTDFQTSPRAEALESHVVLEMQRTLLDQEIAILEKQLADTEDLIRRRRQPNSAVIPLQREILSLKRQKVELEGRVRRDSLDLEVGQTSRQGADEILNPVQIKNACINYLRQLDGAKEQWALENNKKSGDKPDEKEIAEYIRGGIPACPAGGTYFLGAMGETPRCSLADEGHVIEPPKVAASPRTGLNVRLHGLHEMVRRGGMTEKEQELRNQLAERKADRAQIARNLKSKEVLLDTVRDASPAALPSEAAADGRYKELKQQYQEAVLAEESETANQLLQRMDRWVALIYLPELQADIRSLERRLSYFDAELSNLETELKMAEERQKQSPPGQ